MGLLSRIFEPLVTRAPFPEGYEPPKPEPLKPGGPRPQPLALGATEMSEEDFNKRMELIRYHLQRRGYVTTASITTPSNDPWGTLHDFGHGFNFIERETRRRKSGE